MLTNFQYTIREVIKNVCVSPHSHTSFAQCVKASYLGL